MKKDHKENAENDIKDLAGTGLEAEDTSKDKIYSSEIDKLTGFLMENHLHDMEPGQTPIDTAIKLLGDFSDLKESEKTKSDDLKEAIKNLRDDFIERKDMSAMAEHLMKSMLQEHIYDIAMNLYEVEFKMPAHHFLMALIILAYEQGNFPMAASVRDPDWGVETMADRTFLCKCGCGAHPLKRIGQVFATNECHARFTQREKEKEAFKNRDKGNGEQQQTKDVENSTGAPDAGTSITDKFPDAGQV